MHVTSPSSRTPRARRARVPAGGYRLVRTPPPAPVLPDLDARQRAVVDHEGGPLLVLAGPGTGKTTTLVEAVAQRVRRGTDPARVLVLTFSRRAAGELRDRIAARLGGACGTAGVPQATTFHSYCYALVRAHQDPERFAYPLRLLSGPEQDVAVRELLAGQAELARAGRAAVRWPDDLRACLTTRGFADEVRAVLARTRELGLAPGELEAFARRAGRPDWQAAAAFLAEYLDVMGLQGSVDYTELVHRAVPAARERAGDYDAVFVDEYQDTDPAQVRLLAALAGGGRTLVAFGDPDQSIYAFRGADVGGILDFPDTFRRADGRPAPVAVLGVSRRAGAGLLAATRLLTRRMPLTRLPADAVRAHRELAATRDGGRVEALTFPTAGAETDAIADLLRRAHLEDGLPWREMAVLVRSGARSLPVLRRALTSAGVPVEIDGDDLPLREEPAVAPLLLALRVAARAALEEASRAGGDSAATRAEEPQGPADGAAARAEEPQASADGAAARAEEPQASADGAAERPQAADGLPAWLSVEDALTLLTSPLAGLDAADLRALGRALREEERAAGRAVPRPSDVLLAEALAEPERLAAHDPAHAAGARRLGDLLRRARRTLARGGTPQEALWLLWDGTPWPARLERTALRGGAAARNADRDLDAVCALFETAARAEERTGGRGALNLLAELDAQDIAADVLTRRAVRPDAVRLMTAHRSKGLEWPLVVVAGVQEGLWPDLRRRGSLLEADRIGRDGLAEPLPPGALLAEERRLFYVAATRARDRLVVTAVKAPAADGDQPSRFLAELGVEPRDVTVRPRRPLAVAALVAELRATTVDPDATPALRHAAAVRLARLAALTDDDGHALVPAAHPDRWWGLDEPTHTSAPLRDPAEPVALSASALDQLVNTCSLQWFLGREVRAQDPSSTAQGFGNVVHVLADEVTAGRAPARLDVLMERLDSVWDALAFEAPFKSRQEREQARAALERFLRWHVMERGRESVESEHAIDVTLQAGPYAVHVRGSVDRLERDADGRLYVVDFKTGKKAPTGPEVARHPQLAVYQLAVREQTGAEPGGAELVQLRHPAPKKEGGETLPRVQTQPAVDGDWAADLLAEAASRVLEERFVPTPGRHCGHCAFHRTCSARPEGRHVVE
ncbi:ATP-dependent DNA helicase [Streptomyces sp. ICBB 8177]|uniref:ATP-dependent helicase n=1 Tax=Streptomyces sp. ICBB 8177 TaxID=563922 RepID=UPI000D67666B|nr:ATP-dependent DNA helicase [Streptomyces sp. ICBB 8177]PWI44001.1 DNA helicase UvrD [Streptomyces sp. ICBB 8177]